MEEKRAGCVSQMITFCLATCFIFIFVITISNRIYQHQSALVENGVKTEATIELVGHKGILEWGKVYARLQYEVDGETYSNDVEIAMRTYKVPGGKLRDGKTVITAYYDAENPAEVGFEGARDAAKTARTIGIVILCIFGALTLFFAVGLIGLKLQE